MVNKYLEGVNQLKEEIFVLHRKMTAPFHEYSSFRDEDETIHVELELLVNQAKNEETDPSEIEELEQILEEVKISHQNTMQEVVNIIAKLN